MLTLLPNDISNDTVIRTIYSPTNCSTRRLAILTSYARVTRLIRLTKGDIIPTSTPTRLHLTTERAALASRSTNTTTRLLCNVIHSTRASTWGLYGISYVFHTKNFLFKKGSNAVGRAYSRTSTQQRRQLFLLYTTTTTTIYVLLTTTLTPPELAPGTTSRAPVIRLVQISLGATSLRALYVLPGINRGQTRTLLRCHGARNPFQRITSTTRIPNLDRDVITS